jgi:DNA-binding protein YbaB
VRVRFPPSAPSFVAVKILAVQDNNTLHGLVAEAFNDVFAKYGKPEIAPAQAEHLE